MIQLYPLSYKFSSLAASLEAYCVTIQLNLENAQKVVESVNSFFGESIDPNYALEAHIDPKGLSFVAYLRDDVEPDLLNASVEPFLDTFKHYNLKIVQKPKISHSGTYFGSDQYPAWSIFLIYEDQDALQRSLRVSLRFPSTSRKWKISWYEDMHKFMWWEVKSK